MTSDSISNQILLLVIWTHLKMSFTIYPKTNYNVYIFNKM